MNMPDINKKAVNTLMPLETIAKLRKLAMTLGVTVSEVQEMILSSELKKRVQLDADDYRWIANETEKNVKRRAMKSSHKKEDK